MINVVKDLHFAECENCLAFDPSIRITKLYGDFECLEHELEIYCGNAGICTEIRKQLKKEGNNNGADK